MQWLWNINTVIQWYAVVIDVEVTKKVGTVASLQSSCRTTAQRISTKLLYVELGEYWDGWPFEGLFVVNQSSRLTQPGHILGPTVYIVGRRNEYRLSTSSDLLNCLLVVGWSIACARSKKVGKVSAPIKISPTLLISHCEKASCTRDKIVPCKSLPCPKTDMHLDIN